MLPFRRRNLKGNGPGQFPYTPNEIAADVVKVVKAGAAIVHIHVRNDDESKSMSLDKFTEAVELTREACKKEDLDVIINLTTSGGSYIDEERIQHLEKTPPRKCAHLTQVLLTGQNSFVFENHPRLLEKLTKACLEYDVKPEVEVFDSGFMGNTAFYIKKHGLKDPHTLSVYHERSRRYAGHSEKTWPFW